MGDTDKRKQSVYFSGATLEEIAREATRLDRSLSWIMQQAWRMARKDIARFPTAGADDTDVLDNPRAGGDGG